MQKPSFTKSMFQCICENLFDFGLTLLEVILGVILFVFAIGILSFPILYLIGISYITNDTHNNTNVTIGNINTSVGMILIIIASINLFILLMYCCIKDTCNKYDMMISKHKLLIKEYNEQEKNKKNLKEAEIIQESDEEMKREKNNSDDGIVEAKIYKMIVD